MPQSQGSRVRSRDGNQNPGIKAYQAAITQVFVGVGVDVLAEFAPDVKHMIHKDEKNKKTNATDNQQCRRLGERGE